MQLPYASFMVFDVMSSPSSTVGALSLPKIKKVTHASSILKNTE